MMHMILVLVVGLANAKVPDTATAKELTAEMQRIQKIFAAHKVAQGEQVLHLFPEAMRLLALSQNLAETAMPAKQRIEVMLRLALATVPFDETQPAAETLAPDYLAHQVDYEKIFATLPDVPERNRLQISLQANADTLKGMFKGSEIPDKAKAKKP